MLASCAPPPNKTPHPSQAPCSPKFISITLSLYFFFLFISLLISSTMALFSSCAPTTFFTLSSSKPSPSHKPHLTLKKPPPLFVTRSSPENGATAVGSAGSPATAASAAAAAVVEETKKEPLGLKSEEENKEEESLDTNEVALKAEAVPAFKDPRWVSGTWDLKQFDKNGMTDWDALIDAEARRRKWLEDNPESSSNDEPVIFDTSTIPWWAWMKRFHLPEAELLNGRAAMIGFFMAYFVDSLMGMGLVDQTGNFFCKTLLFVAVSGVLFIRKNEDIEKLKKLYEETTFYDKQWQATWQDDTSIDAKSK